MTTREEMWEEFESQLKREVRTPVTMSYDDSIKIAERGIKDVVEKWKERLEKEHYEEIAKAFQLGMAFGFGEKNDKMDKVIDEIKKAIAPQPKTGHWVEETTNEGGRKVFCSECGCPPPFEHVSTGDVYSANGYGVINKTKCCPSCGTRMIEVQE